MTDTPLSDDVVERVARALALDSDIDPDVFIGMHGRDKWEKQWHTAARAALEAARYGKMVECLERQVRCAHYDECKFSFSPFPDCPDCRPKWDKEARALLSSIGASQP